MYIINTNGQTIIEYTLVISIILVVILAMQPMIKRAGQGMIKTMADQIGNQKESDQRSFYANAATTGHLEQSITRTEAVMDKQTAEFLGLTRYVYFDNSDADTEQQSNLGFTPDPLP